MDVGGVWFVELSKLDFGEKYCGLEEIGVVVIVEFVVDDDVDD